MKKLSADFILLPNGSLVKEHTLILTDSGEVADILNSRASDTVFHHGILCPGFINAHCHLELSYMKDAIRRHRLLDGFIEDLVELRKRLTEDESQKTEDTVRHASLASSLMWQSGIQGVGDICNTSDTFEVKQNDAIRYHSFIELFNVDPAYAEFTFNDGVKLLEVARDKKLSASIVPHAPYSVAAPLHFFIKKHSEDHRSPWCIHNQETESENEMFNTLSGRMIDFFQRRGIRLPWQHQYGMRSLEYTSEFFPDASNLMLVHNTFTSVEDVERMKSSGVFERTWWCLCPKANLYIENRLPDVMMLWQKGCRLTIGTDSLASNDTLSVLEELKTIHRHAPEIPVADLLTWATANGAEYFGWSDLGKFEKGTKPGVVLIEGAGEKGFGERVTVERLM